MFDTLTGLANEAKVFILAAATVLWLAATIAIGVIRRSVLATAGVFIAGGFLMWGMWNSDWIRDRSGEDIQGTWAPVVIEIDSPWTATSI